MTAPLRIGDRVALTPAAHLSRALVGLTGGVVTWVYEPGEVAEHAVVIVRFRKQVTVSDSEMVALSFRPDELQRVDR